MIRVVTLGFVAALLACGQSKGVPDEQLGGLVIEPGPPAKLDVEVASKDPAELSRALASTHTLVLASIGIHRVSIDTKTIVEEAGTQVSALTDHAAIELGEAGSYRAAYTNSGDYGRETTYVGGRLFLRPRYQRWHVRAPEFPEEPAQLRDQYFAAIAASWELVEFAAELTDRGPVQVGARPARKIEIKLAPTPRAVPPERQTQRTWREGRSVQALVGEVVLDAEHGVPLAAKLSASVAFSRDGRRFVMKLELDAKVSDLGTIAVIATPPDAEVVATPGRLGEVDERDYLLHGIAPPIRKTADGTAPLPATRSTRAPVSP